MRAVAERTGISAAALTRLEKGQATMTPRANVLAALVRLLEIDVEELYAYTGHGPTGQLPDLPVYLRTRYNLTPEKSARFEALLREVKGDDNSNSPEGHRRNGDHT